MFLLVTTWLRQVGFHYPSGQPCSSAAARLQPLWSLSMMCRLCKSFGLPLSQIPVSLKPQLLCCCCCCYPGCCDFNYRTCTCSFLTIKNEVWFFHSKEALSIHHFLIPRTFNALKNHFSIVCVDVPSSLCCVS